jgi:hypothetical protein
MHLPPGGPPPFSSPGPLSFAKDVVAVQNAKLIARATQETNAVPVDLLDKTELIEIASSFFVSLLNLKRNPRWKPLLSTTALGDRSTHFFGLL